MFCLCRVTSPSAPLPSISYECSKNVEKAQAKKQEIDDGMADIKKQLAEMAEKRQTKEDEMRKLGK